MYAPGKGGTLNTALFGASLTPGGLLKYGAVAVAGAVGAWELFGKGGQQQSQETQQKQATSAEGYTNYTINIPSGYKGNITTQGATAAAVQTAQQTASQIDFGGATNIIILAVLAGVAFMFLRK